MLFCLALADFHPLLPVIVSCPLAETRSLLSEPQPTNSSTVDLWSFIVWQNNSCKFPVNHLYFNMLGQNHARCSFTGRNAELVTTVFIIFYSQTDAPVNTGQSVLPWRVCLCSNVQTREICAGQKNLLHFVTPLPDSGDGTSFILQQDCDPQTQELFKEDLSLKLFIVISFICKSASRLWFSGVMFTVTLTCTSMFTLHINWDGIENWGLTVHL